MRNLWEILSPLTTAIPMPRAQALALLAGLLLLGLALLLLSLTRWGQARPLSKCIALSIFAHLLLILGAYRIGTFHELPGPQDEVFRVVFVAADEPVPVADSTVEPEREAVPELPPPDVAWSPDEVTLEEPLREAAPVADAPREDAPREHAVPDEVPVQEGSVAEAAREADSLEEVLVQDVPGEAVLVDDTLRESSDPVLAERIPPSAEQTETMPGPAVPPVPAPPEELPAEVRALARQLGNLDSLFEDFPAPLPPPLMDRDDAPSARKPAVPHEAEFADPDWEAPLEELTEEPLVVADEDRGAEHAEVFGGEAREESDPRRPPPAATEVAVRPEREAPLPLTPIPPAVRSPELAAPQVQLVPARPADGAPLPKTYRGRAAADRQQLLQQHGGTAETEAAVVSALEWLAANQEPAGHWDVARHGGGMETRVLGHDRGGAGAQADTGISGLALLVFLGSGHSHLEGSYRPTVQRGLEFLIRSQAADGNLAGDARLFARMYCHGMAALAIGEAYALTGDTHLREPLERAVAYTVRAQHPTDGGWRYVPGDAGDMSQFGWQLMALKSAELGGIRLPQSTREGMQRFLQRSSAGRHGGLASYRPHGPPSVTMTAEALVCRLMLFPQRRDAAIDEAVASLMHELPGSDGTMNLYYWYYATMALFQIGGPAWETWNQRLQQQLLAAQATEGAAAGSWPPHTVWGSYGGRVYSTAMAALCLQAYYRYLPLWEDGRF